jgi:pimeloyl-ACP methyl ester carboxylesterase
MNRMTRRDALLKLAACATLVMGAVDVPAAEFGEPPPGFSSANVQVNGSSLHYVRGGSGPPIILVHGCPEDWTEYRAIMPSLAKRFTVVAVDLPGIGKSAPAARGYDSANIATDIHAAAAVLKLDRPYVVGHDLGGVVTYAYVRSFPDDVRGAMILDVPMPGLAGWNEAVSGMWHIGFIQAPGALAEKLVSGRQDVFFGQFLDIGKFTADQRAYYFQAYGEAQIHAAFEIYRAFPKDAEWNAAQSAPNPVPLVVAVGEKSFFNSLLPTFVEGYRAKGMTRVEGARIPGASHYVAADNPDAVAELIQRYAGR